MHWEEQKGQYREREVDPDSMGVPGSSPFLSSRCIPVLSSNDQLTLGHQPFGIGFLLFVSKIPDTASPLSQEPLTMVSLTHSGPPLSHVTFVSTRKDTPSTKLLIDTCWKIVTKY